MGDVQEQQQQRTRKDSMVVPEMMDVQKELQKLANNAETTIASMETTIASIANEAETTLSSLMDSSSSVKDKPSPVTEEKGKQQQQKREVDFRGMDWELVKEVDDSVTTMREKMEVLLRN